MPQYRREHKKVRTGCSTCKSRRIKCDEARPICEKCAKGKHECVYEPVIPRKAAKRVKIESEEPLNVRPPVFGIPQALVSAITDDPTLSDTCSESMLPYGFHSSLTFKLNNYMKSEFYTHFATSKQCQEVYLEAFNKSHEYEYLYHIFMAVLLMDLYHKVEMTGSDDVLNLSQSAYVSMAEFHHSRSLSLMRQNLRPQKPYDALALLLASSLQMFYATASPNHRIADIAYIGVAKGIYLFFNDILPFVGQFQLLEDTYKRYCLGSFSTDASVYFPEFLYGILDLQYFEQDPLTPRTLSSDSDPSPANSVSSGGPSSPEQQSVTPSTFSSSSERSNSGYSAGSPSFEANRDIYKKVLDRLKMEFRAHAYKEPDDNTPGMQIENELISTLSRYVIDVPEQFTELIGINDPRALIIMGYHVMILAARRYPFWSQTLYMYEIDHIYDTLGKLPYGHEWKSWLTAARESIYRLS